jgi:hypothetical protein
MLRHDIFPEFDERCILTFRRTHRGAALRNAAA